VEPHLGSASGLYCQKALLNSFLRFLAVYETNITYYIYYAMNQVQICKRYYLTDQGLLIQVKTGEIHIPKIDNFGYYFIRLKEGRFRIHRLVMKYFGKPSPGPEYEIDHINRNKLDNSINNLRWVTHKENIYNRNETLPEGERHCDIEHKKYMSKATIRSHQKNKEAYNKYMREWRKKKKEGV
jgi:hypothetical protein